MLAAIITYLETWLNNKTAIIEEVKKRYELLNDETSNNLAAKRLEKEIKRYETKLSKIQDLYVNDIITMEQLKEKSAPVKIQLEEAVDKLRCLKQSDYSEEEIEDQLNDMFSDIRKILNAETLTNEMLRKIIDKIEVDHEGKVEVFLKKVDD